jgi:hypothetical protein
LAPANVLKWFSPESALINPLNGTWFSWKQKAESMTTPVFCNFFIPAGEGQVDALKLWFDCYSKFMVPIELVPYHLALLAAFIEWRYQPLTVRHNLLKKMSDEELAAMLQPESPDLTQIGK